MLAKLIGEDGLSMNSDCAPRQSVAGPQLVWVVHDGREVHVSDFAGIPPRGRPPVTCPECGEPVTMHLGTVRAHHAAHRADSICDVRGGGESVIHLNARLYLANQLRKTTTVEIRRTCTCPRPEYRPACEGADVAPWGVTWTGLAARRRQDGLLPDISLYANDDLIGAVEVYVRSAVRHEKAARYAERGIPWLEVEATPALYDRDKGWNPDRPLPVKRAEPLGQWRCPSCATREAAWQARAKRQREDDEERQRREAERERRAELDRQAWDAAAPIRAAAEAARLAATRGRRVGETATRLYQARDSHYLPMRIRVVDVHHPNGDFVRETLLLLRLSLPERPPELKLWAYQQALDLWNHVGAPPDDLARRVDDAVGAYVRRTRAICAPLGDWCNLYTMIFSGAAIAEKWLRDTAFLEWWDAEGRAACYYVVSPGPDEVVYFLSERANALPRTHSWEPGRRRWKPVA